MHSGLSSDIMKELIGLAIATSSFYWLICSVTYYKSIRELLVSSIPNYFSTKKEIYLQILDEIMP